LTFGCTISGASAAKAGFADVLDADRSPLNEAAVAWIRREIQSGDFQARRRKLAAPIDINSSQRESILRRAFAQRNRMPSEQRLTAGAILNVVMTSIQQPVEDACGLEAQCCTSVFDQRPGRALVNVAMLADRIRSDEGGTASRDARRAVRQVGILGAGTMGEGIAAVNLQHGLPVVLQDASPDALTRCLTALEQVMAVEESPDNGTPTAIAAHLDEGQSESDLVIETIVENKDVKQRVLQRLDPHLAPHAIVASNTSTIPISQLAESVSRPEQFCGIHFCNPAHRMPLVEVVRGKKTSESTIRSVVAYAKRIGKLPIVVNDCPGFLINRLLLLYMNEALTLYCEGVPLEQIERVAIRFGMECGPFELFDVIGVDTAMYGGKLLWEAFPDRISLTPVLPAMVKRSWLGRKQGRGFYRYDSDGNRGAVDPELQGILEAYVRPAGPCSDQQIQDRLLLAVVLEATRILEEGIVCDVRDIDSGLVFGLGFPRRCGGLLFWADDIGASQLMEMLKPLAKLGPRMQPTKLLRNMVETGRRFYELEGIASCDG
jgi:3-hydroxyacyl-CoA dehydrogenase